MYKRLGVLLLTFVVGFVACNRRKASEPITHEFTATEYNVISAYVAGMFPDPKSHQLPNRIVILKMTSSGDDDLIRDENGRPVPWEKTGADLRLKAPSLQQTTLDGFRKANVQQAFLSRAFRFPVEYEIIDPIQLEPIFKKNGGNWPAYYKKYPGSQGIGTLSRVGFNTDGSQALFYIKNICGGLCGSGWYIVMEKRADRWIVAKEIEMWIS